jgi:hypothetical protein
MVFAIILLSKFILSSIRHFQSLTYIRIIIAIIKIYHYRFRHQIYNFINMTLDFVLFKVNHYFEQLTQFIYSTILEYFPRVDNFNRF